MVSDIYAFPSIHFDPRTIEAVGYNDGHPVQSEGIGATVLGLAATYTVLVVWSGYAPASFSGRPAAAPAGLKADGQDVALFDVEAVDAIGQRCPTDDARVDFVLHGSAIWRGGYNSGKINSTNNLYLNTECGINRVAIRAARTPGKITLTATRQRLSPATATVFSSPAHVIDGLLPAD